VANDIRIGEYYWFVADDGDVKEGKVISSFRKGFCVLSAFDGTGTYKIQSPDSLFDTDKDCRRAQKGKI
jgi:hypothetical protein